MAENPSGSSVSGLGRVKTWVATPELRIRLGIRAVLVFAVILFVYYVSTAPHFFSVTNATNVGARTAADIIMAVGQTLVIISAGIDLSVGAIVAFSGSLASVAYCYWGVPVWPAILLGLAAGALLGCINGLIITKGGIPDFIATLGMMTTARGLGLILTGGLPVPSHLTAITLKAYLPQEIIWMGSGNILGFPAGSLIALLVVVAGWVIGVAGSDRWPGAGRTYELCQCLDGRWSRVAKHFCRGYRWNQPLRWRRWRHRLIDRCSYHGHPAQRFELAQYAGLCTAGCHGTADHRSRLVRSVAEKVWGLNKLRARLRGGKPLSGSASPPFLPHVSQKGHIW
jgi:hypothetical protein